MPNEKTTDLRILNRYFRAHVTLCHQTWHTKRGSRINPGSGGGAPGKREMPNTHIPSPVQSKA
jgi:hypothetical protein